VQALAAARHLDAASSPSNEILAGDPIIRAVEVFTTQNSPDLPRFQLLPACKLTTNSSSSHGTGQAGNRHTGGQEVEEVDGSVGSEGRRLRRRWRRVVLGSAPPGRDGTAEITSSRITVRPRATSLLCCPCFLLLCFKPLKIRSFHIVCLFSVRILWHKCFVSVAKRLSQERLLLSHLTHLTMFPERSEGSVP